MAKRKLSAAARKATPRRERVTLMLDDALRVERDRLNEEMVLAGRLGENDRARELAEQVVDLERRMDEATEEFVFERVAPADFWAVYNAHPPRDIDKRVGLSYNFETILVPLAKLCLVEPEVDDEATLVGFVDKLSLGQREQLSQAAVNANLWSGDPGKSAGAYALTVRTRASQDGPSTTPSNGPSSKSGTKATATS